MVVCMKRNHAWVVAVCVGGITIAGGTSIAKTIARANAANNQSANNQTVTTGPPVTIERPSPATSPTVPSSAPPSALPSATVVRYEDVYVYENGEPAPAPTVTPNLSGAEPIAVDIASATSQRATAPPSIPRTSKEASKPKPSNGSAPNNGASNSGAAKDAAPRIESNDAGSDSDGSDDGVDEAASVEEPASGDDAIQSKSNREGEASNDHVVTAAAATNQSKQSAFEQGDGQDD